MTEQSSPPQAPAPVPPPRPRWLKVLLISLVVALLLLLGSHLLRGGGGPGKHGPGMHQSQGAAAATPHSPKGAV